MCVRVRRRVYPSVHVELREQFEEVGALLLSCGSQGLNSASQAWQQASLPAPAPAISPAPY